MYSFRVILLIPSRKLLLFKIWFDWQQSSFCFLGLVGFLILIYGLTIAASSYGNTLVLWIVSTTKSLQNVNNLLIANLAFSDIMIALLCTPFQFYAALAQKWQLPEIMCKICPFFQCVCVNVNIFNLVLIAQDRWVWLFIITNSSHVFTNLFHWIVCQNGLWSFQTGGTKLERFCLWINILKGNYWILRIGLVGTSEVYKNLSFRNQLFSPNWWIMKFW